VLPRGRGTTPTLRWAGLPCSDLRDTAADAREGRLPALSGVQHHDQGLPGRSRIGYGSAEGNATGGHPGAVNCNAVSSPCRSPRI